MFESLSARAAALGAAAAARRRRRIAAEATAAGVPPGVTVREGADAIVVAGPGLSTRRLRDGGLRAFLEALR